ncbi:MAG: hypothetical protein CYPHOPRED_004317 [Cyphobasidiales sp. Tagirdzhanova-0007]|nr:MAG: hypothetical protein CYPHOPRED_004317 [Cyphobasidiales sp. Tagirdzhanova-0007]
MAIRGSVLVRPLRRAYYRYLAPLDVPTPAPESIERLERIVLLGYCTLPGFSNAVVRSFIDGPNFDYHKPFQALAKTDLEILVIWGTNDATVPYSMSSELMASVGSGAVLRTV